MSAFMIAALRSSSGKTVLSSAIARAMSKYAVVSPFKTGPDYIDSRHLSLAADNQCYNLDTVLTKNHSMKSIFRQYSKDISLVEGAMGFFDGLNPVTFGGSSYEVAKLLKIPVILVVDAKGAAASVIAPVKGAVELASGVNISGVIFNRVASSRQADILKAAMGVHLPDIRIVGIVPENDVLYMPSRHLGLMPADDDSYFENIASYISECVDFAYLNSFPGAEKFQTGIGRRTPDKCAYVAHDEAFYFYYPVMYDYLESQGYAVKFFSPLKDEAVEGADLIILGGGYPEAYAEKLSKVANTKQSILAHHNAGKKIHAECGGFVYLMNSLTVDGTAFPMLGIFDIDAEMTSRRQRLGYVYNSYVKKNGHAFHYSRITRCGENHVGENTKLSTGEKFPDGWLKNNTYAGYTHYMYTIFDN